MASLERHGQTYRIVFRYQGRKQQVRLKTDKNHQALGDLYRFKEVQRLIELGTIDPPPAGIDPGLYILSGGKFKNSDSAPRKSATLGDMFESYRKNFPRGAKEDDTRRTESIHLDHLARLLGKNVTLDAVTTELLQRYIGRRSREKGHHGQTVCRDRIAKEIDTLAAVWNRWAIPQGMAARPAPTKGLIYPKARNKPPFQTRTQVERQIARGGLTGCPESLCIARIVAGAIYGCNLNKETGRDNDTEVVSQRH